MSSPFYSHLTAENRVLRYVQDTMHHVLQLNPGPLTLSAFTNVDWVDDPFNQRYTTSYLVFLGSSPISWFTKKRSTISKSSIEVEYYLALATTIVELSWLSHFLQRASLS